MEVDQMVAPCKQFEYEELYAAIGVMLALFEILGSCPKDFVDFVSLARKFAEKQWPGYLKEYPQEKAEQDSGDDSISEVEVAEILGTGSVEEPLPELCANDFGDYIVALISTGGYPVSLDKWHMAEQMNGPGLMHFIFQNRDMVQEVLKALQTAEEEYSGGEQKSLNLESL